MVGKEYFVSDFFSFRAGAFDFDGTINLLTEGWHEVMQELFEETLFRYVSFSESAAVEEKKAIAQFIFEATGKPSIFQCIRMTEELARYGGPELAAEELHEEFSGRLRRRLEERERAVREGYVSADDHMVPGARRFLETLHGHGLCLMLVSGTEDEIVQRQCRLLGLDRFFQGGVFGASGDVRSFAKPTVIRDFMKRIDVNPSELVGFGDGCVETRFVHEIGGFAVGMATREHERDGQVNEWKKSRLLECGADLIAPDFNAFFQAPRFSG